VKKLKLFIFTHEFPPKTGGAGRYSLGIAQGISALGQEVFVLTRNLPSESRQPAPSGNFKIVRRSASTLFYNFIYFLKTYKPDHVLVTQSTAQQECSRARIFSSFKYSVFVYGSELIRYNQTKQPYRRLWQKASSILPISEFSKRLLIDSARLDSKAQGKISIIPGGVDQNFLSNKSNPQALKEKLKIKDEKVLLTLARLDPRKGQDTVLEALPQIIPHVPKIKYIIAGTGNDLARLQKIVAQQKLNDYVIFAGFVPEDQLTDYYDLCDIFVMPSKQDDQMVEGFGLSFLEANARGKPVIGGRHGGVTDAIIDGETGLLVNPDNQTELADAIIKLSKNEPLARRLGENGKLRCFASFSWESIAQKILINIGGAER
jgi:phosphatidylinositol alpha-1,6-mannosyltransferase